MKRPCLIVVALSTMVGMPALQSRAQDSPVPARRQPNVILILADDLGYGELGCYGQTKIRTPRLDALAREGMRFTDFYSGSPVCAPSRCTLLTGLHTGHAFIRDNKEIGGWGPDEPEGQLPVPAGTITLGGILQQHGYATAAIGKWGLGGPGSTGAPNAQGFDLFYGYLCQRVAHNYYPTHLWRNGEKDMLDGNEWFAAHQRLEVAPADAGDYDKYASSTFAPDRMLNEALRFIDDNRERPFFLYFATPVPHVAIQVPDESVRPYLDEGWDTEPYLGQKGYLPHPHPRAAYAAMISRLDRDIGTMLDRLDELGLAENTIVLFTSDNGPTYAGGVDYEFFNSAGPLRGLKGSLYEGGIRVPLIARWPGRIEAGGETDHAGGLWDLLPTIGALVGLDAASMPVATDGLSFAPTLLGEPQPAHPYLYWEYQGHQAVRRGDFKAFKKRGEETIELYDLAADDFEGVDVAADHAPVVDAVRRIMREGRTTSGDFPLRRE